jgi:hypothetical protein
MRLFFHAAGIAAATLAISASAISRATPEFRWGADGHRIIAEIALARLAPAAANETRNDVKVTFNGKSTNLHSLWDSGLLLSFGGELK